MGSLQSALPSILSIDWFILDLLKSVFRSLGSPWVPRSSELFLLLRTVVHTMPWGHDICRGALVVEDGGAGGGDRHPLTSEYASQQKRCILLACFQQQNEARFVDLVFCQIGRDSNIHHWPTHKLP